VWFNGYTMNIKKSSWHYKFINSHEINGPPGNLCSYFGTLVSLMLVWALLWWLILPTIMIFTLEERLSRKLKKEAKEPGLIRCWISAKKRKICPLIQFIEVM